MRMQKGEGERERGRNRGEGERGEGRGGERGRCETYQFVICDEPYFHPICCLAARKPSL